MILTDVNGVRSRTRFTEGSDVRIRSAEYFDGYVDCLRDHMRQSHRWGGLLALVAVEALLAVAVVLGVFALTGEFSDGWL